VEIHRPSASHTWREFLIEIGTITLGILIALGLESLIESVRDRHLLNNANSDLRHELQVNRQDLVQAIANAKTSAGLLSALIDDSEQWLRSGSPAVQARVDSNAKRLTPSVTTLSTAAWEAAGVSQAVVHMPLSEAQALARAYAASRVFNGLEDRATDRWFELSGLGSSLNEMERPQIQAGISSLKVLLSYEDTIVASGSVVLQEYDAALAALGHG
jgi:hypothetical protein